MNASEIMPDIIGVKLTARPLWLVQAQLVTAECIPNARFSGTREISGACWHCLHEREIVERQ